MSDDKVTFDANEFSAVEATVNADWSAGYEVAMSIARGSNDRLIAKAKALVDAVSHDNNGSMVAGRYVGGNGGLYSTEAIKTADALRLELDRWK